MIWVRNQKWSHFKYCFNYKKGVKVAHFETTIKFD